VDQLLEEVTARKHLVGEDSQSSKRKEENHEYWVPIPCLPAFSVAFPVGRVSRETSDFNGQSESSMNGKR
jgi:hypothetical protein